MGAIGEVEIKKAIYEKKFSNLYFVYGDESYLKQHYVGRIQKKLVSKSLEVFNFHSFEGKNLSLQDVFQAAEMLPMMAEKSCVLVHDYPFDKITESERKTLKEYIAEPSESCVLIFWMDNISVDSKNSKWKTIIGYFSKSGESVCLPRRDNRSLSKLLVDGAKKRNCNLSPAVADYVITVVGNDMQTLLNELEKMCSFVSEGEISRTVVDSVATKSLSAKAFDLAKALIRKDYQGAYGMLNNLIAMREEPIVILSAISSSYVDMYRVKCAKIAGKQPIDLSRHFNYHGKEFRLSNASRDCQQMSIEQLRNSVSVLMDADAKLKSTSLNGKLVLEEMMVRLLLIGKGHIV